MSKISASILYFRFPHQNPVPIFPPPTKRATFPAYLTLFYLGQPKNISLQQSISKIFFM